jgi:hypothetical protein
LRGKRIDLGKHLVDGCHVDGLVFQIGTSFFKRSRK